MYTTQTAPARGLSTENSTLCSVVRGPRPKKLHDKTGEFSGILTSGLCFYLFVSFAIVCASFSFFARAQSLRSVRVSVRPAPAWDEPSLHGSCVFSFPSRAASSYAASSHSTVMTPVCASYDPLSASVARATLAWLFLQFSFSAPSLSAARTCAPTSNRHVRISLLSASMLKHRDTRRVRDRTPPRTGSGPPGGGIGDRLRAHVFAVGKG